MAVAHSTYLAVYAELGSLEDARRLAESSELSYDALHSILSLKQLHLTKLNMRRHRENARGYVARYEAGESIIDLSTREGISPTIMARLVLEERLGVRRGKEAGQLLKHVEQIEEERLRAQVAAAVEADAFNGPYVDTVKRLVGIEYECVLQQKLMMSNVPFITEEEMRSRGDAKTPDALLTVPLLARGRVVNWIDSKATFGDPTSHAQYYESQYR
ncbi:MAG: hypothetical protein SGPRY_006994 [Prymnesium sp.]